MNKILLFKRELENLLESKKEYIGRHNEGIDMIITGTLFMFSWACSDYRKVWVISSGTIRSLAFLVGVIIIIVGIYQAVVSKISNYTYINLCEDIMNINKIEHAHSIVAIKDTYNKFNNRFLVYYDNEWKCWFFPNFKTKEGRDADVANIIERISNRLHIDKACIQVEYKTSACQEKLSIPENMMKVYDHSLYYAIIGAWNEECQKDEFVIDSVMYRWMTIEDMERDDVIKERNSDVVSLVKDNIA